MLWLSIIWQSVIAVAISRVNQFDAARLDVEMSAMLKEQLVKVFNLMKVCVCVYSSSILRPCFCLLNLNPHFF